MDSSDAATVMIVIIASAIFCPWAFIVAGIAAVVVIVSSIPSDSSVLLNETINNLNEHPEDWELVGEPEPVPATGKKNPGGTSTEETYRNRNTGQEVERHTLRDKNGNIIDQHWRLPK